VYVVRQANILMEIVKTHWSFYKYILYFSAFPRNEERKFYIIKAIWSFISKKIVSRVIF